MANLDLTYNGSAEGRLNGFFNKVSERLALRRAYKQTVAELSDLDTRTLADLGLSRSQIRSAAYEAVYLGK